jgi:hypothetical protein
MKDTRCPLLEFETEEYDREAPVLKKRTRFTLWPSAGRVLAAITLVLVIAALTGAGKLDVALLGELARRFLFR